MQMVHSIPCNFRCQLSLGWLSLRMALRYAIVFSLSVCLSVRPSLLNFFWFICCCFSCCFVLFVCVRVSWFRSCLNLLFFGSVVGYLCLNKDSYLPPPPLGEGSRESGQGNRWWQG